MVDKARRVGRRLIQPLRVEDDYADRMRKRAVEQFEVIRGALSSAQQNITAAQTTADRMRVARAMMARARASWGRRAPPMPAHLERYATGVDTHSVEFYERLNAEVLAVPVVVATMTPAMKTRWVRANIERIDEHDTYNFMQVERRLVEAAAGTSDLDFLPGFLEEREQASASRGDLLARDETFNLGAELNEERAQDVGLNGYVWMTMQDDKVRSSHADRQGGVFTWDSPPSGGHPGQDYGCRCWAVPVEDA